MFIRSGMMAVLLVALAASVAPAQVGVTRGDIDRLQDAVFDAGSEIARLRDRDQSRADTLQAELDEIREEVVYLKVKLRREGGVPRSEYADLRDRIEDLRARTREERPAVGEASPAEPARPAAPERPATSVVDSRTVPVNTEVDVRLQAPLSSGTNQVEDRFDATALVDLAIGSTVLIPAGSVMRGVVTAVDKASRTDRKGSLSVSFDRVTINGRSYPMRGTVTQAIESEGVRGEAARIGTGAGVGAVIGGILGGFKGALAGILIGGGGVVAATPGKDVELPAGTVLRVRFDSPLTVQ